MVNENDWVERYWEKVEIRGPDACWPWRACIKSTGYGLFNSGIKTRTAHRISWELRNGEIPEGLCVLHHCDRPDCVNPAHLWLGSQADNLRDMREKGRGQIPVMRGERNGSSKLTPEKIREIHKLYATGEYLQRDLGERFGISRRHIGDIVNQKAWAWLAQ